MKQEKRTDEFTNFETLARHVFRVPKSEVLKLERKRKKRKPHAKKVSLCFKYISAISILS